MESKIPHKRDSTFACLDCSIRAAKYIIEQILQTKTSLSPQAERVIKAMCNWVHFEDNLSYEDKPTLEKFKKGELSARAKKWVNDEFQAFV